MMLSQSIRGFLSKFGRMTIVIGIFFATHSLFVNCSDMNFSSQEGSGASNDDNQGLGNGADGLGGDGSQPEDGSEVFDTCSQLKASGKLLTKDVEIVFHESKMDSGRSHVCLFGQDGNLSIRNGYQRARHEQYRYLKLPSGARLCDLDIQMKTQSFRYDDMFYLSMNGRLLASNNSKAMGDLKTETIVLKDGHLVPSPVYNWNYLKDKSFNNNSVSNYCLGQEQGESYCEWPMTEKNGDFRFEYSAEILTHLGVQSSSSHHEIMFAVTGDNDLNVDCSHSGFSFDIKAKYYVK